MDQDKDSSLQGLIYSHVRTLSKGELQLFRAELAKALPHFVSEAAARAKAEAEARKDQQAAGSKQR
jgi:hypothetical protein